MKRPLFRVGIAQLNTVVGDLEGNARRVRAFLERGAESRCDLVVCPELTLTGYPPEDLLFKKHFIADNLRVLARLARTSPADALVGFVDRDRAGRLYNAAAAVVGRRLAGVYHKMCLPNYGVFDEKRYFAPGRAPLVLDTPAGLLGLSICEDLWPDDSPAIRGLRWVRPSLVVNLSASPYHFGKQRLREKLFRSRAHDLGCPIVYANLVGGQDELVFDGSSLCLGGRGERLAAAESFEEDFLVHDLKLAPPGARRRAAGAVFRKADLGGAPRPARTPVPPRRESRRPDSVGEIYRALCLGTRDYVRKNGFRKVVVGVSGGIDSALVATIAADSIGAANVVLVTMPSRFTSAGTLADSLRLGRNLGTPCLRISIEPLRKLYLKALEPLFRGLPPSEAEENVQARIRGTLLMALSNKFGYLVLTTGNKSEFATGYCTLYGDMAGGFAVLKDVPKMTVYALARYRNASGPRPVIPPTILSRAPSAELRPHQKDSDSLPPYPVLDPILEAYVEKDLSAEAIGRRGFPKALVQSVVRRVDLAEYKRRQGPIGIKITPKAFGRDRRMPITNAYR